MGTGIGKYCKRCGFQLNFDNGFNLEETLCRQCENIVRFDLKSEEEKKEILGDNKSKLNHYKYMSKQKKVKEKQLEIANCSDCAEMRDLKDDRNARCHIHRVEDEIISEDELTDMFGEGGKEELKEFYLTQKL